MFIVKIYCINYLFQNKKNILLTIKKILCHIPEVIEISLFANNIIILVRVTDLEI